jgi:hypothetical protein
MKYDDGRVRVDECPLCLGTHEYDVHLVTKPMQVVLSDNQEADRCATPVTALYYCPNVKKEFEQEVVVTHRAYEFLRDMKTRLVGLEEEEENDE